MFGSTLQIHPGDTPKKPIFIAMLSLLLFGGVGQLQLGQTRKGVIILIATVALIAVGVGFIIWIVGVIDAYIMAEKLYQGESIGDMQWFWES